MRLPFLLLASLAAPALAQAPADLLNPSLPVAQRVDALVRAMTLEEKAGQMMNASPAIPRLGIPTYDWWSEGLHGVARSGYATVFPQAIGMAATWDKALIGREAEVISTEARAKYNVASAAGNRGRYYGLTIWSPNINIFRDPRWGRGQETYGEDPFLTGSLAKEFVRGLQGVDPHAYRTIATPKHFAVHSGPESTRHKFNVEPSPHDLEDTYLPAFRATIVDAKADSIMCAYNAVDGAPACASPLLLKDTLRGAWGFQGFVTSDCGAVDDFFNGHGFSTDAEHAAAAAVLAGTDTNCGDTYRALPKAVHDGLLPESALDTAVRRLFTARVELGLFDPPLPGNAAATASWQLPAPASAEIDSLQHQALALFAARESMVLLKNDGTLPLKSSVKTVAVVGPNAASLLGLEGNYNAIPSQPALPVDGIRQGLSGVKVLYAQGSPYAENLALPAPRNLFRTAGGEEGLTGAYYRSPDLTGAPAATRVDKQLDFDWTFAAPVHGLDEKSYSVRWTGTITPPRPGSYTFATKLGRCEDDCGPSRTTEQAAVFLDGKLVAPKGAESGVATRTPELTLVFPDAKPHAITVDFRHLGARTPAMFSLRWTPPVDLEREEAVAAARQADAVVAVVGLNSELEGEEMRTHTPGFAGGDRTSLDLPAAQEQLLQALAATGKPLVVVAENGSALSLNWAAAHANAILEAWYPGEQGGTALADILAGRVNPSGRLPVTFYASANDLPPFDDYSMRGRTYRYFQGKPLWPFGYGLSYTRFAYSGLKLNTAKLAAGEPLTVEAEVRNTGSVAGEAVAELYLTPPAGPLAPLRQLVAFDRAPLAPGETRRLHWQLGPRELSTVDAEGRRAVRAGAYTLALGSPDPEASAKLTIEGEQPLPK